MSDLKGNMKLQMYSYASRAARFSRLPHDSPCCAATATSAPKNTAQFSGSLLLAAVGLLFLIETGSLFAQQTAPGDQGWSQNNQDTRQYAPSEQSEQQSDYGQQPDAQRPYPDSGQAYPQVGYGQAPAQPLDAGQLEQLVAPIALYPDRLVAQILAASTYPSDVADADHWRQTQGYASSDQIAAGADVQNWDPSVKALTAFPQVLAQMERNLQWTTDLGNAYYNQTQDVLEAVQVMRRRAEQAGNLQSTPQQAVHYDQGYVQLMPVDPQVVYVPTYNPWTVYGEQVSPYPGFSLLGAVESFFGSSRINYGLGIAMSAFSQTPWGWLAWGLNWLAQSVLFNQSDYHSHSATVADWGFRHDGLHAYAGRTSFARYGNGRTWDGYRRFGGGHNATRGQGFGHTPGRYAENWRGNSNAGFHAFGSGYDRAPHQAHNHMQAAENGGQFNRNSNGSSLNRSTGGDHHGWAGGGYGRSMLAHRAPTSGFQTSEFRGRSSGVFANRDFAHSAGKPPHWGSVHMFGGHAPKSVSTRGSGGFHMGGGGHAPKSFHGGGKSFGGAHSHGGGGHSSGHGGKHHR
jgi:hypothetical protein